MTTASYASAPEEVRINELDRLHDVAIERVENVLLTASSHPITRTLPEICHAEALARYLSRRGTHGLIKSRSMDSSRRLATLGRWVIASVLAIREFVVELCSARVAPLFAWSQLKSQEYAFAPAASYIAFWRILGVTDRDRPEADFEGWVHLSR